MNSIEAIVITVCAEWPVMEFHLVISVYIKLLIKKVSWNENY